MEPLFWSEPAIHSLKASLAIVIVIYSCSFFPCKYDYQNIFYTTFKHHNRNNCFSNLIFNWKSGKQIIWSYQIFMEDLVIETNEPIFLAYWKIHIYFLNTYISSFLGNRQHRDDNYRRKWIWRTGIYDV